MASASETFPEKLPILQTADVTGKEKKEVSYGGPRPEFYFSRSFQKEG